MLNRGVLIEGSAKRSPNIKQRWIEMGNARERIRGKNVWYILYFIDG